MNLNLVRVPEKGHDATSQSMNASATLATYMVERMAGFSILANVVETLASLAGTLKLQASNNAWLDNVNMDVNPNAVWVDIPSSSVSLTAGNTTVMWNTTDVFYETVRVVWTHTTGQGTFTPYFMAKS